MKIGVIFYHKNLSSIYKDRWISKSIESIFNQTITDFKCYEVDYGNTDTTFVKKYTSNLDFYSTDLVNYADAMNFIISKSFEDGCDVIFNVNMDDYYHPTRFEKQLKYVENYDIISSDFCYIEDDGIDDKITTYMNICKYGDIKTNLNNNHNIIAHPSVCMHKRFWKSNRYDITKTPSEDMELWKKSINNGYKFHIINEVLLYYRIHKNQVSKKNG